MVERLHKQEREARGGYPSITELLIVVYVFGFIYGEMKALWNDGLLEYTKDLWNFVDFGSNFFYMNWIFLRCVIIAVDISITIDLIIVIVIIYVIIIAIIVIILVTISYQNWMQYFITIILHNIFIMSMDIVIVCVCVCYINAVAFVVIIIFF